MVQYLQYVSIIMLTGINTWLYFALPKQICRHTFTNVHRHVLACPRVNFRLFLTTRKGHSWDLLYSGLMLIFIIYFSIYE